MWLLARCYLILTLGLALVASQAHAQQPAACQVDTANSRVYVKVAAATRLGHSHGIEGRLASGAFTLGGTGELVFDMTTFTADTAQARQYVGLPKAFAASDAQKVTANMRGGDVLDVGRFPKATLTISEVTPAGGQKAGEPGTYRVAGRFTLHGVTQPVAFDATVEAPDRPGTLHVRGSFAIQQTAFGITPYSAVGGLVRIADQLDISGDLFVTSGGR